MMEINTIHWLPRHLSDMREFKEITKAYDYLLQHAIYGLQKYFNNGFLDTLDQDGCQLHEEFLGIMPNVFDTVEERRNRIKGYYASDIPYTEKKLDSVLKTMCGPDGYELFVNGDSYQVEILIKLSALNVIDNVEEIARQIIPANMVMKVNRRITNDTDSEIFMAGITEVSVIQTI